MPRHPIHVQADLRRMARELRAITQEADDIRLAQRAAFARDWVTSALSIVDAQVEALRDVTVTRLEAAPLGCARQGKPTAEAAANRS